MEKEKTCKNCAWYRQHYIKKPGRLLAIHCGSCLKSRKKHFQHIPCENWKAAEADICKQKEYIYAKLKAMSKYIHDIALILKFDEELKNNKKG